MTEEQVLEVIEKVVKRLAKKWTFGYYDVEDIQQEGTIEAMKGLEDYDGIRPLENFLYTHVHNRLYNLRRDKYERLNKPCIKCEFYDKYCKKSTNECTAFSDKMECGKWADWINRNSSKKNIMQPYNIEETSETSYVYSSNDMLERLSNDEIMDIIDREISIECRPLWIKLRNNIKLFKTEYKKLLDEIKEICQQKQITPPKT